MDEIDYSLCMMLMWNSRTPYRELTENFQMSVKDSFISNIGLQIIH